MILFVLYLSFFSLSLILSFLFIYLTFSFAPSFFFLLLPFYRTNFNCCAFSQSRLPFWRGPLISLYLILSLSYFLFLLFSLSYIYISLILSFFLYLSLSIPRIFLSSHCNIQYIYLYTLGRCLSVCLSLVSISKCATFFCTARRAQNQTAIY